MLINRAFQRLKKPRKDGFLLKNKWKELKIWKVITNYGKEIV